MAEKVPPDLFQALFKSNRIKCKVELPLGVLGGVVGSERHTRKRTHTHTQTHTHTHTHRHTDTHRAISNLSMHVWQ